MGEQYLKDQERFQSKSEEYTKKLEQYWKEDAEPGSSSDVRKKLAQEFSQKEREIIFKEWDRGSMKVSDIAKRYNTYVTVVNQMCEKMKKGISFKSPDVRKATLEEFS